ncbi:MAG: RNA-binding S4 domain-containing protein [Bacillota bacterium]|nr:RNA-binding S4 domain-containing protein [Bacillota bacterium]
MRLDKYLKVSRIIKRRTVAKEVCDAGRIQVNGRPAKAGTDIEVGDKLSISYGGRLTEAEVLIVAETMRADQSSTMYRILSEQRISDMLREENPME